ncbi:MAG: short-chain dehydrogenase/reductase, partial [Chryseobacterium sp.]
MSKIWYITGASKGLGLALTKKLLKEGQKVIATTRTVDALIENVEANSSNLLPLKVDLTSDEEIRSSIEQGISHFGGLDVVVNNAGFGIGGSIEELSDYEVRESLDINILATIRVIHHALPHLRKQRSGHIINIASIGGVSASLGWSVYSATKFAIVGLSEGLALDVKNLGIKVTALAPGAFRTEFLTKESLSIAKNQISDYEDVHASILKFDKMNGNQIGDPDKAAEVMLSLSEMQNPPYLLFIGSDAYKRASNQAEI